MPVDVAEPGIGLVTSGPDERIPPGTATPAPLVKVVVKIGGSLLSDSRTFGDVVIALGSAGRGRRMVIVPGGGPFADAVRGVDRQLGLSDEAAHWMAILAMDQYAHLIASRLTGAVMVTHPLKDGARTPALRLPPSAESHARIPVLAPYAWLREADPLPHSWDVTSDSIAAWVAGQIGASRLVLVKPPGAVAGDRMDRLCREKARKRGWTPEQVYQEYVQEMALRRVTTAEDVAHAVCFLCTDESRAMTGQCLTVDGGWDV